MKLLFCQECQDVRKLFSETVRCACGRSSGRYTDSLNAEIGGLAIPIGFDNPSLSAALRNRPEAGMGRDFTAFVIPRSCPTVKAA